MFLDFSFSQKRPAKSQILYSIKRTGSGKLSCLLQRLRLNVYTKNVMALEKVKHLIFDRFFETFRLLSKTNFPNLRFLIQSNETVV